MNRVYIAGRYARRDEFRSYREQLQQAGVTVTSRWLDETHSLSGSMSEMSEKERIETAVKDIEDVLTADSLLFFAEEAYNQPPRGGRHVEFGVALALNKHIFVVGEQENIFHFWPGIKHYPTFEDFLKDGGNFN